MKTHIIKGFARRLPDPVFRGVERHVFITPVLELPSEIQRDPNPREQKINRSIYRDIAQHLRNEEGHPNSFHLKNKGITIVASDVTKLQDDVYKLHLAEGDGIVDGAHTYELLTKNQEAIANLNEDLDEDDRIEQYIKIEVLTGLPRHFVTEMAGGLNTAVQVQEFSLANQQGEFDWIVDELKDKAYFNDIAFRENEDTQYDVRDVIAMLYMFNVHAFPNDGYDHPVKAYSSKKRVLEHYLRDRDQYESLSEVLHDVLVLRDTISFEARDLHNQTGGKGAALSFINSRQRGTYKFPFIDATAQYSLHKGALYPMLASFRCLVQIDEDSGKARWTMPFDKVLDLWREVGGELMRATQATNDELGRKANAIGRSRNHWSNLYNMVVARSLLMRNQEMAAQAEMFADQRKKITT